MNQFSHLYASLVFLLATAGLSAQLSSGFSGRWALTAPDGRAAWIEIRPEAGWYDGSIIWAVGKIFPLANVTVEGDVLTVTRVREIPRKGPVQAAKSQTLTETITAQRDGDTLKLTRLLPRPDGSGFERSHFFGRRIPALPPPPELKTIRFGEPVTLLDGRSLTGWEALESDRPNDWSVDNGVLANRPRRPEPGSKGPHPKSANLRTVAEFADCHLHLEFTVPAGSNSGVYVRGIYEVQIMDSFGQPPDLHNMGSVHSRLAPSVAADKPPGEWQTLDITLVDRHITVILNGTTIIDNQPLQGCTGGALWSDEFRPGPVYLQGDHGPVSFRNLTLRPVIRP